jgi:hypothetical protein
LKVLTKKTADSKCSIYLLFTPQIFSACGVRNLEHSFLTQALKFRTDVLTLHFQMVSDLFDTPGSIRSEVNLSPALTFPKDLLHRTEMFFSFGAKRKGLSLINSIDSVFDFANTTK